MEGGSGDNTLYELCLCSSDSRANLFTEFQCVESQVMIRLGAGSNDFVNQVINLQLVTTVHTR